MGGEDFINILVKHQSKKEQLRKSKIKITLLIKMESEHLGRGCFEMFTWMKSKQP